MTNRKADSEVLFGNRLSSNVSLRYIKEHCGVIQGVPGTGVAPNLFLSPETFSKHILLIGGIGEGKTNTMFQLMDCSQKDSEPDTEKDLYLRAFSVLASEFSNLTGYKQNISISQEYRTRVMEEMLSVLAYTTPACAPASDIVAEPDESVIPKNANTVIPEDPVPLDIPIHVDQEKDAPAPGVPNHFITAREYAERKDVNVDTVYMWVNRKKMAPAYYVKTSGNRLYIDPEATVTDGRKKRVQHSVR